MKATFRLSMTWLHRWSGLVFGWALYVIALTGTIVVFGDEIGAWMQPELPAAPVPLATAVTQGEAWLRQHAPPGATNWSILPSAHHGGVAVGWASATDGRNAMLDAATGAVVTPRDTHGAEPLVTLHFQLHSGAIGMWVVAASGMVMLVGLVTGVIVHRRIFRDFFTFRPGKGQRSWLDAHNVAGVLTLPFQLVIAFTGLMIFPVLLMPGALQARYGGDRAAYVADWYAPTQRDASGQRAPLARIAGLLPRAEALLGGKVTQVAVTHPGNRAAVVTFWRATDDRLSMMSDWAAFDGATGHPLGHQTRYPRGIDASGVMVGLHFASFGGGWTRWLYVLSGAAGTALIATGLLLWRVKRGGRLVATLNLATIAGLPLAIAAYFAANRLLPFDLPDRGAWEVRVLFLAWVASLGWAAVRPSRATWPAMALLAVALLAIALGPVTLTLILATAGFVALAAGRRAIGFTLLAASLVPAIPTAGVGLFTWAMALSPPALLVVAWRTSRR